MLKNRTFLVFTGVSLLLHAAVLLLAHFLPDYSPQKETVMEVNIADIPRSLDFLPPEPGIIKERRPAPPPKQKRETMVGRVPDLPVNKELPPEKSFPASSAETKETQQAKSEKEQQPKAAPPQDEPETESSSLAESSGSGPSPRGDSPRSLRDMTPSLGKLVLTQNEPSGGRGKGEGRGDAVGTEGKASEKKGVVEESGGGFRLTPLNAPEIQYISYFASIKRKIELVWQYPYDAAVQGIQGDLYIDFVIERDGKVASIDMVQGSGYKILDDEAVRSIRKAAPFDPIPAEYSIPHLQIRGRFVYTHGGQLRILR